MMKNATILASQSSVISLGSFVNTLFVENSELLSGAVRPFDSGVLYLFAFVKNAWN
ncbi:MAG: hypothetical protein IKZ47_05125 [Clostridia bacterium]|nr:hypothetical protein [Clostridia bacterium]